MNWHCKFKKILLINLLVLAGYANAAVSVYPIEVNIGKSGNSKIEVISSSEKVAFVKVSVKKIINPGTPHEKELEVEGLDKNGLIVTPLKLAITPGSKRIVRMVTLDTPEKETTWRVYFQEVSSDEYNNVSDNSMHGETKAEVGVNIVWGALVHVLPKIPTYNLILNTKTGSIYNAGTSRIKIKGICKRSYDGKCNWKESGSTIYPDMSVNVFPFKYSSGNYYKVKFINNADGKEEEIPLNITSG
ncbi:hypothetical protein [Pantoea stewartii]|uniref:hypothetical protein n=1 Tax=Pantoea stewartii TaxID=66269 RepID=UPI0007361E32|nr:hypothetical protein [Pantoea stewartii]